MVHPTVGEVHSRRIGVVKLFGKDCDFSSSASSSSSTSSKNSNNNAKKRPCLIWRTSPNVQVLVMASFGGTDVTDRSNSFMNHLDRDYVLKRLLAVHEKKPFGERRSITAATSNPPLLTTNTHLILIPTLDEDDRPYKRSHEYFPREELEYIHKILLEIQAEEREEQVKTLQEINPPSTYYDDDNDKNDTNSSSTSSLPRVRTNFIEEINLNKNDRVEKWLNDSE